MGRATRTCLPSPRRWASPRPRSSWPGRARAGGSLLQARWPRCRSADTPPSPWPSRTPTGTARASWPSTRRPSIQVTTTGSDGRTTATLVSVSPRTVPIADADRRACLTALRWDERDSIPRCRCASPTPEPGTLSSPAATRERLADLDYDFDALGALMADHDWTTIDLVWRESPSIVHARNPFPPGGVVEDPATGAGRGGVRRLPARAGSGRCAARVVVHQGDDLGRPSLLTIDIPADPASGIAVTGPAVPLRPNSYRTNSYRADSYLLTGRRPARRTSCFDRCSAIARSVQPARGRSHSAGPGGEQPQVERAAEPGQPLAGLVQVEFGERREVGVGRDQVLPVPSGRLGGPAGQHRLDSAKWSSR